MNKIKLLIEKYTTKNALFANFIKVFSVDVLVRGANFLLIFIFVRLMSKEQFGIYGYLYSFSMTMSLIVGFGLYTSIQKLYADTINNKEKQKSMLFTVSCSLIIFVGLAFVIMYISNLDVFFFSKMNTSNDISISLYQKYRIFVFIAILAMLLSNYILNYFVSAVKIRNIQLFNILRLVLENGICISFLVFSHSKETALIRIASVYITELIIIAIFSSSIIKNCKPVFDMFYFKKALKIGLPIMATSIFGAFMNFGDKYYIMKYDGASKFASYSLASQLSTIILIVFQSFNFIWLPSILKEKDLIVVKRKMKHNTILLFGVFLLLSIGIFVFSWILLLLNIFPSTYFDMLSVLPILLIAQIFNALTGFYTNLMIYFEKTYIQFIVSAIIALLSYIFYDICIKQFGFVGAGLVYLGVNIFGLSMYVWRSFKYINNRLKQ